ncbi:hypothetical protein XBP1_930087 [Xenorhabdus bovienii str. puntauvense]|uniref:Uncharacterized protein n=1 Tax=Xenorhabdus bovienii str. puntauvense TaxID=1398201 RepID=A0A077NM51_XENBV|nr:hypothetical protein XBP1_930087 [Xenorhabdus bovienii str. puntauvense]
MVITQSVQLFLVIDQIAKIGLSSLHMNDYIENLFIHKSQIYNLILILSRWVSSGARLRQA